MGLLSLAIWTPIAFGALLLAFGSDKHAGAVRWLALIGALIGGLIGNSVGDDGNRAGATIAGVIIGGVIGNAMSKDLDCDDRSYAYRSYYNGFNSGRPGARYGWTNPRTSRRGDVVVDNYYTDRYGFRCANFTQTVYFQGRPRVTRGRACRQPDGAWAVLD